MRIAAALLAAGLLFPALPSGAAGPKDSAYWERSFVTIEASRKRYEYFQPWAQQSESVQKMGVVLGPREILTTADRLSDLTLVRVQRGGRGAWWPAKLQWIDYHANLAIVGVEEAAFWKDLRPVTLADPVPTSGEVQVLRWRNGKMDNRRAAINRFVVKRGPLTFVEHLLLELDAEIPGLGWSEPVVSGTSVIGLACLAAGNTCTVLPTAFFKPILEARKKGTFAGIGYFDFVWDKSENPATLRHLKLPGPPRGALVVQPGNKPGREPVLKRHDIILQVDGFAIDNEGDYKDPHYGNLPLENLSNRGRSAGDEVRFLVWRDGAEQQIIYKLPKAEYTDDLVPDHLFDRPPEYVLSGGLLFQPLTGPFLRAWGPEWRQRLPFRLTYYEQEKPKPERPSLVILSSILPDPYNLGYTDYRMMVVDRINGRRVVRLSDVQEALKRPEGGYHLVEFAPGEPLRRMVLNAAQTDAATRRVLERYGIERTEFVAPAASAAQ